MRKNVTIGFPPAEYIRVEGAAAVANMPLATYLKWLLRGGAPHDELAQGIGTVLERLDRIGVAIARLSWIAKAEQSLSIHSAKAGRPLDRNWTSAGHVAQKESDAAAR